MQEREVVRRYPEPHGPLVSGDFFPGDLLMAVVRSDPAFWKSQPELRSEVLAVIDQLPRLPADQADDLTFLQPNLTPLLARFHRT